MFGFPVRHGANFMRRRAFFLGLAFVAIAQAVTAPAVRADFTTNPRVFSIPLTPTNWGSDTRSLVGLDPIVMDKFNPAAFSVGGKTAVLEGVNVRIDYEFDNTLSMHFFNMSTISVTATETLNIQDTHGAAFLTSKTFVNTETLTANPSTVLGGTVTFPTRTFTGTMSSSAGGFTGGLLQQFLGTGTTRLPVVAQASSTFSTSSGNGFGSSVTEAKASITISYRYALVPEPSSVVLLGMGSLGLLGVCSQRFRRKGLKAA
jgi:hypothetical protein